MAFSGKNELVHLKLNDREILLVGTAHVSQKSIDLVEKTFDDFRPDVVALELDQERLQKLINPREWQQTNIMDAIRQGKTYMILLNLFLASFQKKIGLKFNLNPGGEMLAAFNLAEKNNKRVALIDMPVKISLKKALAEMALVEKLKFFYFSLLAAMGYGFEHITEEKIEQLKQKDTLDELMVELGRKFPSLKKVLVDDRNSFIASSLLDLKEKKILAVVGYGHLHGIESLLKKNKRTDRKKLLEINQKKSILRFLKFLLPALIIALFLAVFNFKGLNALTDALILWFLVNGVFSAIAAFLAKSHWKTIAAAFIAAPFTSLNPFLAAGWIAALVEAKQRTPAVSDFESLHELQSFSDFNKNALTHLLLVAAYTNIGSTIATLLVLPVIAGMLL